MVESIFQFSLFRVFAALLEKVITVFGEKFRRLAARVGLLGHRVVVDELSASLVERGHEAVVVAKRRQHERVVLLVHLQDCAHVQFRILT